MASVSPPLADEGRFARRAVVSLVAVAASLVLAIITTGAAAVVVATAPSGRSAYEDAVAVADLIELTGVFLVIVAVGVSLVLWLIWFAAAMERLPALGIRFPRQSTAASVIWWFVPIANLFMPKRATNDLWRSGELAAPVDDPHWTGRAVPRSVHWWWAACVTYFVISGVTFQWFPDATAPRAELLAYYGVSLTTWSVALVCVVLTIPLTRAIEERQAARAAQIGMSFPPA